MNKDGDIYSVRFISIGEKYPNSELREYISSGIWADDYNFVYSVRGRGIFIYNAKDRTYKTVITGNKDFKIKRITSTGLYYDELDYIELNID